VKHYETEQLQFLGAKEFGGKEKIL